MFTKQVEHIGPVGRFRKGAAEGDVIFKKHALILGGNGKTMLCSTLRSLEPNSRPAGPLRQVPQLHVRPGDAA